MSPLSVLTQVALKPIFTTLPFTPLYSTESWSRRTPSESIRIPEIMLLRVFCNAREIANPAIPERVKKENIDPNPVTIMSQAATKTTQRILSPSRTFLIKSADAPALLAPLVMSLISNSETSQDPAMTAPNSATKTIVPLSTKGARPSLCVATHIQMPSTLSAVIILRFDKP